MSLLNPIRWAPSHPVPVARDGACDIFHRSHPIAIGGSGRVFKPSLRGIADSGIRERFLRVTKASPLPLPGFHGLKTRSSPEKSYANEEDRAQKLLSCWCEQFNYNRIRRPAFDRLSANRVPV